MGNVNLPWLTNSVVMAIKKRNSLFRAAKKSRSSAALLKYRAARNRATALLRLNKNKFFKRLGNSSNKDFWKAIKSLSNKDSCVPTLKHEGRDVDSNPDKAQVLNNFFHQCFNRSLPPLPSHSSWLDPTNFPENLLCTEDAVSDLVTNLDASKATGPDDISARMLKETAPSIVYSLTKLFNLSLTSGKLPSAWKLARVVPVPKSNDLSAPSNYRPISILSIISKIMERCVYQTIFDHLCVCYPLSARQWGFLPGRSTTSALLAVTHDWLSNLDNGIEVCTVYLDLRKAFDSVPHCALLQKLYNIHLDPYIIQWINSYLAERSQMVVVGGACSPVLPVISGVPQGSVLGPLLFLLYINDVINVISPESSLSLFADDMAIYRPIRSQHDYYRLQLDISAISEWIEDNYLSLQPTKCCAMLISRKRVDSHALPILYVQDVPLPYVSSVKYLGVLISCNLSWSDHVTALNKKARRLIGILYRTFYKHAESSTLVKLYLSNIRPHLEYCSPVWNPHLRKDIDQLERAQKFGLKVCLKDWSSNYNDLLQKGDVPNLSKRRTIATLSHLHKIVHDQTDFPGAPVVRRTFHYDSRADNSLSLLPFRCKSSQFLNSYFPQSVTRWNSLPAEVVSLTSTLSFKRSITKLIS